VPPNTPKSIGTMQEGSLHSSLKAWYMLPGDRCEVTVDGYLVDIVRGELLIEIQTRNFAALKQKLKTLIERHPIRLVYPIPQEKWIVHMAADGQTPEGRRRSPKRGSVEQLFDELVSFPQLFRKPSFSLEVLMIREEELRCRAALRSRKEWSTIDHRLLQVVDRAIFQSPLDLRDLLPKGLQPPFTSRDLAIALQQPHRLAQRMAYCLRGMSALAVVGKRGNSLLYVPSTP
jgi:hypothetical protein